MFLKSWRDGSAAKSSGCSTKGPEFDPQHPHGASQLSITLVLVYIIPPSELTWCTGTLAGKTFIHISLETKELQMHNYKDTVVFI